MCWASSGVSTLPARGKAHHGHNLSLAAVPITSFPWLPKTPTGVRRAFLHPGNSACTTRRSKGAMTLLLRAVHSKSSALSSGPVALFQVRSPIFTPPQTFAIFFALSTNHQRDGKATHTTICKNRESDGCEFLSGKLAFHGRLIKVGHHPPEARRHGCLYRESRILPIYH